MGMPEVFDDYNMKGADEKVPYDMPKVTDLKITSSMKIVFILCGLVGMIFSLINYGTFPAMIWLIAVIFVADMLGSFDAVKDFLGDVGKPRGGYESIG